VGLDKYGKDAGLLSVSCMLLISGKLPVMLNVDSPMCMPAAQFAGTVIAHSCASTGRYIGSPSIVIWQPGIYVASHDIFGPGSGSDTTHVFISNDGGQTWEKISQVDGQFWSTLFVQRGALYLMGTSREYGYVTIRRSEDGGRTWSEARDGQSGLLLADGMYHSAPVPVVRHHGRIWRAMEEYTGPRWGAFRAFVMSASEDSDLLNAASWSCTNRVEPNAAWLGGQVGGFLEGNVCTAPDGKLVNLLRVHQPDFHECAARMEIDETAMSLSFDPARGFFTLPGGSKKFTIRWDAVSQAYYALVNAIPGCQPVEGRRPDQVRNHLCLARSADLIRWDVICTILEHPDAVTVGFQYADWQFEGADIIAVVRTAFPERDGSPAHNAHDANWLTFQRIPNFRESL